MADLHSIENVDTHSEFGSDGDMGFSPANSPFGDFEDDDTYSGGDTLLHQQAFGTSTAAAQQRG